MDVRLIQVNRVVDHRDDRQDVVVPREELRHRIHVGGLWPAAPEEPVLQMGGRDLQRVANPLTRRKAGPRMRRVSRGMRPPVHEDGPIERSHELNV
jgi:hypothetical protein